MESRLIFTIGQSCFLGAAAIAAALSGNLDDDRVDAFHPSQLLVLETA